MKRIRTIGCICLLLIFLFTLATGNAETLHLYHGIPFETASQKDLELALRDITDASATDSHGMLRVNDFGYPFDLQVDFYGNGTGFDRMVLHRPGNGYGEGEAFRLLAEKDFQQFIDLEQQMIDLYGEPDHRFFYTSTAGKWTRWMFSDGEWDVHRLRTVFDQEQYIRANSVWGNVTLEVWANGVERRSRGYLTKLKLQYASQPEWKSPPQVAFYPEH